MILGTTVLFSAVPTSAGLGASVRAGAARVDITPEGPIRMAGYSARRTESEGVEQRLWAKALAIDGGTTGPAVLLSVENCEVPGWVTEEVASRLRKKAAVSRERFVLCSTHTHSAPCLKGSLPAMFGEPLPSDQQVRVDRYTDSLVEKLAAVSLDALAARQPAQLDWAQGEVGFATNRRAKQDNGQYRIGVNNSGPVDPALPLLRVRDAAGRPFAVVANYACHCTTLGSDFNRICGDWGGYAQEYVEGAHPGVMCLITIGCGADADPQPRTGLEYAKQHGRVFATEISRLLSAGSFKPVNGVPTCRLERIVLPFDTIPPRKDWEELARHDGQIGYHARMQLARLDRGESLQKELDYSVQTWVWGQDLAMVFLAGEVVVDYSLRLKRELDANRLWVTAYANDVPCYIPSNRVLSEGGYEAEYSMLYYDRPARLGPKVEDLVIGAVHRLLPDGFRTMKTPSPGKQAHQ